ncbi:hypothetical protein CYMTET_38722 [Cymbomonas tetramitiformis]|uniref:Uncharacterized protein n=1 Tax=Cymbomonas tetramitiformis TaxID=36881 RepID=A0AAE0CBH3_9CHLO|nr:hypothetical protein CYMTET_38722 [Cymbomonas tetramitiformis]
MKDTLRRANSGLFSTTPKQKSNWVLVDSNDWDRSLDLESDRRGGLMAQCETNSWFSYYLTIFLVLFTSLAFVFSPVRYHLQASLPSLHDAVSTATSSWRVRDFAATQAPLENASNSVALHPRPYSLNPEEQLEEYPEGYTPFPTRKLQEAAGEAKSSGLELFLQRALPQATTPETGSEAPAEEASSVGAEAPAEGEEEVSSVAAEAPAEGEEEASSGEEEASSVGAEASSEGEEAPAESWGVSVGGTETSPEQAGVLVDGEEKPSEVDVVSDSGAGPGGEAVAGVGIESGVREDVQRRDESEDRGNREGGVGEDAKAAGTREEAESSGSARGTDIEDKDGASADGSELAEHRESAEVLEGRADRKALPEMDGVEGTELEGGEESERKTAVGGQEGRSAEAGTAGVVRGKPDGSPAEVADAEGVEAAEAEGRTGVEGVSRNVIEDTLEAEVTGGVFEEAASKSIEDGLLLQGDAEVNSQGASPGGESDAAAGTKDSPSEVAQAGGVKQNGAVKGEEGWEAWFPSLDSQAKAEVEVAATASDALDTESSAELSGSNSIKGPADSSGSEAEGSPAQPGPEPVGAEQGRGRAVEGGRPGPEGAGEEGQAMKTADAGPVTAGEHGEDVTSDVGIAKLGALEQKIAELQKYAALERKVAELELQINASRGLVGASQLQAELGGPPSAEGLRSGLPPGSPSGDVLPGSPTTLDEEGNSLSNTIQAVQQAIQKAEASISKPGNPEYHKGSTAPSFDNDNATEAAQNEEGSNSNSSRALLLSEELADLLKPGCSKTHFVTKHDHLAISPAVVNYTRTRLRNAKMSAEPYQHIFISKIFDPEFYACLLMHLPPAASGDLKQLLGASGHRVSIRIAGKDTDEEETEQTLLTSGVSRVFWRAFSQAFGGRKMSEEWVRKFSTTLKPRLRRAGVAYPYGPRRAGVKIPQPGMKSSNFTSQIKLSKDRPGYDSEPHTDGDGSLVSAIYYLPGDSKHTKLGTLVLKSRKAEVSKVGSGKKPWSSGSFRVVKAMRYIPNSVFAFAPCWRSWHAVKKLDLDESGRTTLQVSIQTSKKANKQQCA